MWTFWLNSLLSLVLFCLACSAGSSSMIGSSEPIVGLVGYDVVLPCQVDPPQEIWSTDPVDWIRVDRDGDEFVYQLQNGNNKVPDPDLRFHLFRSQLTKGNVSLKLYGLKISDHGTYECHLPKVKSLKENSGCKVHLKLGAVSKPKIHIVRQAKDGGLDLQCEAEGLYPQPKMKWRVGEAIKDERMATEEVKKTQDGFYTVTSNITINKTLHSGIICQVLLDALNLTRQENFPVQSFLFNKHTDLELKLHCERCAAEGRAEGRAEGAIGAVVVAVVGAIAVTTFFCFFKKQIGVAKENNANRAAGSMEREEIAGEDVESGCGRVLINDEEVRFSNSRSPESSSVRDHTVSSSEAETAETPQPGCSSQRDVLVY